MALAMVNGAELTEAQFESISSLVKSLCGINLHTGKKGLVKARLSKRIRQLGLRDFDQYLDRVRNDQSGEELTAMLDALSTNLTSFFREPDHFEYLSRRVLPGLAAARTGPRRRLRIWSAGCSSGEEPYSIAITVCEALDDARAWDARILATDLSTRVLEVAREGLYPRRRVQAVPGQWLGRYLDLARTRPERVYRVREKLRRMVHFARQNLVGPWPMRGPFDAIFCRNVMIYFDKATQARVVERFWNLLGKGGTLFVGHSESLTGIRHRFRYVQPTVYEKPRQVGHGGG